jgi:hypothetical protein
MNIGQVLLALGAVMAIAGLAVAIRPSLAAGVSPTYTVVTVAGVLALIQAIGVLSSRIQADRSAAAFTEIEQVRSFSPPGNRFDDDLRQLPQTAGRDADRQRTVVRERLRAAAVAVLMRYEGYDRESAEWALDEGIWTDDSRAAAFFASTEVETPLSARIRDIVTAEQAFSRRAGAVATVLDDRVTDGRTRRKSASLHDEQDFPNEHSGLAK